MIIDIIKDGLNSFKLIQNKPASRICLQENLEILRPLLKKLNSNLYNFLPESQQFISIINKLNNKLQRNCYISIISRAIPKT